MGNQKRRTMAVVGLGTIGVPAAQLLAMMGSDLVLVDGDRVEEKNLARQLFRPGDVGRPKAACAAETLSVLRPALRVEAVTEDCRNLGPGFYDRFDTILACVDSLAVEAWLGDVAQMVGVHLLRPATTGAEAGAGSASVRWYPAGGGVCGQCWFSEAVYSLAGRRAACGSHQEVNPSAGVFQTAEDGYIAAGLAIKTLAGPPPTACKVQVRGRVDRAETRVTPIEARQGCPGYHAARTAKGVRLDADLTLGSLFRTAADRLHSSPEDVLLDTGSQPLVVLSGCLRCGTSGAPGFLRFPRGNRLCSRCGAELGLVQEATLVSRTSLGKLLDVPLSLLGPPKGWGGVFRAGPSEVLIYLKRGDEFDGGLTHV